MEMQIQFKYKYETHHLYILSTSHQRHEDGLFEYPCRTLGSQRTLRNRTARCVFDQVDQINNTDDTKDTFQMIPQIKLRGSSFNIKLYKNHLEKRVTEESPTMSWPFVKSVVDKFPSMFPYLQVCITYLSISK